jgi:hypothetical protein
MSDLGRPSKYYERQARAIPDIEVTQGGSHIKLKDKCTGEVEFLPRHKHLSPGVERKVQKFLTARQIAVIAVLIAIALFVAIIL